MTAPAVTVIGCDGGSPPPGAAAAALAGAALVVGARQRQGAVLAWDSTGQDGAGEYGASQDGAGLDWAGPDAAGPDRAGPGGAAGMALGSARAAVGPAVEVMMVDFSGRKLVAAWPGRSS